MGQGQPRVIDVNRDGIKDTIVHIAATNRFKIKYAVDGRTIERETLFFEGFGEGIANMSFGARNSSLWFSIRFAPKYVNEDTLWFSFDKRKADWRLVKMSTYTFNTMDPKLISQTCSFRLNQKLWLLADRYEQLQEIAKSKENRIGEKCLTKQEH